MRNLKAGALLLQRNCLRHRAHCSLLATTPRFERMSFHCKKTCDRRDRQKQKSKAGKKSS
jgi:hypothetical protein